MDRALACLSVFSFILLLGCTSSSDSHPLLRVIRGNSTPSPADSPNILPTNTQTTPQIPTNPDVKLPETPQAIPSQSVPGQQNVQPANPPQEKPPAQTGTLETHDHYLLFVPEHPNLLNDSVIIAGFSPSGDADSEINAWRAAAEKRGWPIFASKTFHNGELPDEFGYDLLDDIRNVTARFGYPKTKLVATGLSGGGQFSQAFAVSSPSMITAVVPNCGIIKRGYYELKEYYPRNKIVLFIASPTDFRYAEMKEDREFLASLGWKTGWIEFEGGHMMAPQSTYEQAAEWLEQAIGDAK